MILLTVFAIILFYWNGIIEK